MTLAHYRVTRTDESGDYTQKDYRSFKAAQAQLVRWTNELNLVTGEKLRLSMEVY